MASHILSLSNGNKEASVTSEMAFLKRDPLWENEKPYRMRYQPAESVPHTNFLVEHNEVTIHDMRLQLPKLSLEKNGFEVHQLDTALPYEDFADYEKVTNIYIRELEDLVRRVCKAKHTKALDYELRKRHETFPISTGRSYEFAQPSLMTHTDVTIEGTRNIVRELYGPSANRILESRIQCVTWVALLQTMNKELMDNRVWKALKGPVEDWPLALCDARSLDIVNDVVDADAVYQHSVSENCMVHHNANQTWFYLGEQKSNEIFIFKAADSNNKLAAPCAHGSFHLPGKAEALQRESIDVRILVMHADVDYPETNVWSP